MDGLKAYPKSLYKAVYGANAAPAKKPRIPAQLSRAAGKVTQDAWPVAVLTALVWAMARSWG